MNDQTENHNLSLNNTSYEELYKNLLNSMEKYSKENNQEALDQIKLCVSELENFTLLKLAEKLDNSYTIQLHYLQNLKLEGYSLEKIFSKPATNISNNINNPNNNYILNNLNTSNTINSQQLKNNYNNVSSNQRKNSYQP